MTDRDKRALEAIIAFKKEHGFSPTYREIGERSGLKSTASVAKAIKNLVNEGYIAEPKFKKRAIEVLKEIDPRPNVLKPCPICGASVEINEFREGTRYGNNVDYAAKIECCCGLSFEKEWTEINAADEIIKVEDDIFSAWNKRSANNG